ncbi:hypothetical protein [Massilia antarctica]|uniref:hypothetical protein n=1 Tax=Massilia antarctica TaxID=2765360 RepID=UPI0022720670|nr:hypothetical protein [Massilia sp. H27-R4]MCY0915575.1 hypothetical protein [Massilia sp. H27-R4]
MRCLIVGTAKSGTTALLYTVAQAMGGQPVVHMEDRISALQVLPEHTVVKLLFEHESGPAISAFGAAFDKRILLVRDPRDNLISRLLYMVANSPAMLGDQPCLRVFCQLLQRKQQVPASVSLQQFPPMGKPSEFLASSCAQIQALAAFAAGAGADWHILRYEDLVAGRLDSVAAYLGLPVQAGARVDPQYQRVARTKGAGDWRHWFSGADVALLRPLLAPMMAALGYADDWTLAPQPHITPEHSWMYFERLVRERRQHFGLAPLALPGPDQLQPGAVVRLSKADIINRLIRQFGFKTFLEYNKFEGASFYGDIVCDSKAIAYQRENLHFDAMRARHLLRVTAGADLGQLLPLAALLERHAGQRFDIIFLDPTHERPEVDLALRALAALLNPGGVLVVHDCNPEREELTVVKRRHGAWVGETYKAFALLRQHNRASTVTVSEDYGVGLVWNKDLVLDYPIEADISYAQFAARREAYNGLISYQQFLERSERGDIATLFAQPAAPAPLRFQPRPAPPASLECQLFWRRPGADFSEDDALTRALPADGSVQALHFTLPPGAAPVERLRFDMADAIVAVRIEAIELRNPADALMWTWDPAAHAGQDWRNVRFHDTGADGLFQLATSADPQFYPALPATILGQLGPGWQVLVVMAAQPPLVSALLAALADAPQHQRDARQARA